MKTFIAYLKSGIPNFLKSIVVGFGAVSAGLSGSILMVLFGLYEKVINTIGSIFKNFWKNVLFLIPIVLGCGVGAILFSKLITFLLEAFPLQTRFAFLGLAIGTLPLFYREVKKNGFSKKYYLFTAGAFAIGLCLLIFKNSLFPTVTQAPNFLFSVIIGFAVAACFIIPGVDSTVTLSFFGIYDIFTKSLSELSFDNFNLHFFLPLGIGLCFGVLTVSFVMSKLLKHFYTATFASLFGFFISIIPSVLNSDCVIGANIQTVIAFILLILGIAVSFYFSDIQKNNEKIKSLFSKKKKQKTE